MVSITRRTGMMVVFLAGIICWADACAQVSRDLRFIMDNTPVARPFSEPPPEHLFYETSEAKILALGILRSYQIFVSSQQNNLRVCTFLPSCSNFSMTAIKQHNLFTGVLLSADRLQRCHTNNRYLYVLHPGTGKRLDPAEFYLPYTETNCEF